MLTAKSGNNVEYIYINKVSKGLCEAFISLAMMYVPYPKNIKEQWLSLFFIRPHVSGYYVSPEFYYESLTLYTDQENDMPDNVFAVLTKFKNIEAPVITSFFIDNNFENKTKTTNQITFCDLCIHDRNNFFRLYYDDQFNKWDKKRYDEDVGNLLKDTFSAIEQFYKKRNQNQTMSDKEIILKYINLL